VRWRSLLQNLRTSSDHANDIHSIWARFWLRQPVNLATHDYPDPTGATPTGWRRVWRIGAPSSHFLSVEPCAHDAVARIAFRGDWLHWICREHAYLRRDVSAQFRVPTAVLRQTPATAPPSTGHPILLSYL
jgi:hypothetical protein